MTSPKGTAAITGAAGGLGSAYARALASRGYDLFLTDRASDAVATLASELQQAAHVHVDVVDADLTIDADIERIETHLAGMNELTLLINNAGFGTFSLFHEAVLARQLDMVSVHDLATMRFCHAVLPGMIARKAGGIINVASAAAFMRFPRDATYIGSKSFLVAFTECLAIELANSGVKLQAFCPAWLRTGFSASEDFRRAAYTSPVPAFLFISPERAVASSLCAIEKGGRVTLTPTVRARLATSLIGSRLGLAAFGLIRQRRTKRNASSGRDSNIP
jgi:short-subunit dehydrogenase